jgi:PAS domain-containing protein
MSTADGQALGTEGTLFDRVPIGLLRVTPGGRILEANAALVQMLGYPDRATLVARNASDL